jgi:hypothetical protein
VPDDRVHLPDEAMPSWLLMPGLESPGRAAKHRLVAETRRLIAAVTVVVADDDAAARIDSAADDVAAVVRELHHVPRFAAGPGDAGGDDARLLERSGISGGSNPLSAPVRLWLDGPLVRGAAVYGYPYEGPPGCVHGGFVAAAFDDLLGTAQTLSGIAGFTGTLTVRMVAPTPLNKRIDYEAGVTSLEGRKIRVWGRSTHDGEVTAEAEGLFIVPRAGMQDERMARARAHLHIEKGDIIPPSAPN